MSEVPLYPEGPRAPNERKGPQWSDGVQHGPASGQRLETGPPRDGRARLGTDGPAAGLSSAGRG